MTTLCDAIPVVRASIAANFRPRFESIGQAVRQQASLLQAYGDAGATLTEGSVGLNIGLAPARVCSR